MAIPNIYKDLTPTNPNANLSPLQLALINYMQSGTVPPFFINNDFLTEMKKLSDGDALSPVALDLKTYLPRDPDISPGITGLAYVSLGDSVYLLRQAQDCGPDEQVRYETVSVGNRAQVAEGTFAYYGGPIDNGTVSRGSGGWELIFNPLLGRTTLQYVLYEGTNSSSD